MDDRDYMQLAIAKAREGVLRGETPFGACIVDEERVISCAHNTVWSSMDITAHAEIQALRQACAARGSIALSGCTMYSTCEPCPMCFSACHWAGLKRIAYGASIEDALRIGFNELVITSFTMCTLSNSSIELVSGLLLDENLSLFAEWTDRALCSAY